MLSGGESATVEAGSPAAGEERRATMWVDVEGRDRGPGKRGVGEGGGSRGGEEGTVMAVEEGSEGRQRGWREGDVAGSERGSGE